MPAGSASGLVDLCQLAPRLLDRAPVASSTPSCAASRRTRSSSGTRCSDGAGRLGTGSPRCGHAVPEGLGYGAHGRDVELGDPGRGERRDDQSGAHHLRRHRVEHRGGQHALDLVDDRAGQPDAVLAGQATGSRGERWVSWRR